MASSARVPKVDDRITSARELREKYNSYINADPALVESRRWIEVRGDLSFLVAILYLRSPCSTHGHNNQLHFIIHDNF